MVRPSTVNTTTRASKRPTSPAEITTETIKGTFFTVFERLCEQITSFVSGHWGKLTAVFLLVFGCVVFLREHDDSFAAGVERFMTMLSLTLFFLL